MANYMNSSPGWASAIQVGETGAEEDRLRRVIQLRKSLGQNTVDQEARLASLTSPSYSGPSAWEIQAQQELNSALFPTSSTTRSFSTKRTVQQPAPVQPRSTDPQDDLGTGRQMLSKALSQLRAPVDVAALNEFAQQRAREGDSSMLNALAAQFAGERFQPFQAQYLKRAAAAQEPMKIGNYGAIAGGRFVADPYAQRDVEADAGLKAAGELIASEDRRYGSNLGFEEAKLRSKSNVYGLTPGQLQISARRIGELAGKADAAKNALAAIPSMEQAISEMPDGIFQPIISNVAQIGASLGISRAEKLAAAGQLADAISKQFGIAKLSDIGGNDTDRELMVAITTTYNGTNLREVNKKLLQLFKNVSERNVDRFNDAQRWQNRYGSIYSVDGNDLTFDEWFDAKSKPKSVENSAQQSNAGKVVVDY